MPSGQQDVVPKRGQKGEIIYILWFSVDARHALWYPCVERNWSVSQTGGIQFEQGSNGEDTCRPEEGAQKGEEQGRREDGSGDRGVSGLQGQEDDPEVSQSAAEGRPPRPHRPR